MSTELTDESKVSSTRASSERYLAATSKVQPALPASTSQDVATNRLEEETGDDGADCHSNQELSKFDEVAASESLLMLSGGGGSGGDISFWFRANWAPESWIPGPNFPSRESEQLVPNLHLTLI